MLCSVSGRRKAMSSRIFKLLGLLGVCVANSGVNRKEVQQLSLAEQHFLLEGLQHDIDHEVAVVCLVLSPAPCESSDKGVSNQLHSTTLIAQIAPWLFVERLLQHANQTQMVQRTYLSALHMEIVKVPPGINYREVQRAVEQVGECIISVVSGSQEAGIDVSKFFVTGNRRTDHQAQTARDLTAISDLLGLLTTKPHAILQWNLGTSGIDSANGRLHLNRRRVGRGLGASSKSVSPSFQPWYGERLRWHSNALLFVPEPRDEVEYFRDVIALIDDGCDATHPETTPVEFSWRCSDETNPDCRVGWDFVDGDDNPFDPSFSHGSSVASVILARNDGTGVCHDHCRVVCLRVVDDKGHINGLNVARAIDFALQLGIRVISIPARLSVQHWRRGSAFWYSVKRAMAHEAMVVAAAPGAGDVSVLRHLNGVATSNETLSDPPLGGDVRIDPFMNSNDEWDDYPQNLLVVGSYNVEFQSYDPLTTSVDKRASHSSLDVDVLAPGENLSGTSPPYKADDSKTIDGVYVSTISNGSDYASAHVAAVLATILHQAPDLSLKRILSLVKQSCNPVDAPMRIQCGGTIDFGRAVKLARQVGKSNKHRQQAAYLNTMRQQWYSDSPTAAPLNNSWDSTERLKPTPSSSWVSRSLQEESVVSFWGAHLGKVTGVDMEAPHQNGSFIEWENPSVSATLLTRTTSSTASTTLTGTKSAPIIATYSSATHSPPEITEETRIDTATPSSDAITQIFTATTPTAHSTHTPTTFPRTSSTLPTGTSTTPTSPPGPSLTGITSGASKTVITSIPTLPNEVMAPASKDRIRKAVGPRSRKHTEKENRMKRFQEKALPWRQDALIYRFNGYLARAIRSQAYLFGLVIKRLVDKASQKKQSKTKEGGDAHQLFSKLGARVDTAESYVEDTFANLLLEQSQASPWRTKYAKGRWGDTALPPRSNALAQWKTN
eukprot:GHVN01059210.1.p1 GENE.GHVN01059210.1~~GHVN01059210.1.p1  ORF type:complete len:949 (+),score=79.96 GHVN01059210.1:3404-6250(+)